MSHDFVANTHPLVRKLESVFSLSENQKEAILALPMQVADIKADQDIVREGDSPSRCCLMLDGFACSYKVTGEGKRQILAFHIPGDVPDLQSLHLTVLDNNLSTLSPSKVGFIQHEALRALCENHPRITAAFWRETLIDGSIFREWITNVGRRDAKSRMAHVLCEMMARMRAVGLVRGHTCELPLTQSELGDALGVSTVHVNRVLQELRAAGTIILKGTTLTIQDWEALRHVGEFDPTYLHFRRTEAAAA